MISQKPKKHPEKRKGGTYRHGITENCKKKKSPVEGVGLVLRGSEWVRNRGFRRLLRILLSLVGIDFGEAGGKGSWL